MININKKYHLIYLLVFAMSVTTKPMDYMSLSCKVASFCSLGKAFLAKIGFINALTEKIKLDNVSSEETEFIHQTLREQNVPNQDSIEITYSPIPRTWASHANIIGILYEKQLPMAYIIETDNGITNIDPTQLPSKNDLLSLSQEEIITVIKKLSQAMIVDMCLYDALGYKNFISQKIDSYRADSSSISLERYQKALLTIENSLEMHRASLMHEMGHIACKHTTGLPALKAVLAYGPLSCILSTKLTYVVM